MIVDVLVLRELIITDSANDITSDKIFIIGESGGSHVCFFGSYTQLLKKYGLPFNVCSLTHWNLFLSTVNIPICPIVDTLKGLYDGELVFLNLLDMVTVLSYHIPPNDQYQAGSTVSLNSDYVKYSDRISQFVHGSSSLINELLNSEQFFIAEDIAHIKRDTYEIRSTQLDLVGDKLTLFSRSLIALSALSRVVDYAQLHNELRHITSSQLCVVHPYIVFIDITILADVFDVSATNIKSDNRPKFLYVNVP